jgi:hypothetical protein
VKPSCATAALPLALLVACRAAESGAPPAAPGAPAVPLGPTEPTVRVVGRFTARVQPRLGRVELVAVTDRASFDFSAGSSIWTTCAGGPCLPPPGGLSLWTDQTAVTYAGYDGTCYSNGAKIDCGPLPPPCKSPGAFCAPLAMVSNHAAPLSDVVVQLSQQKNLANAIDGCLDEADTLGLCTGSGKVDDPQSNLISPIPGDPQLGTEACSFCYGNAARAMSADLPGLQHTVVPGLDGALAGIDTAVVALQLENDNDMDVTITVLAASPSFDPPGQQVVLDEGGVPVDCARPGVTRVTIAGGGFGPPGECLTTMPPSACPESGTPGAGYQARLGATALEEVVWSHTAVSGRVPLDAKSGAVALFTPEVPGGIATTDAVRLCAELDKPALVVSGAEHIGGGNIEASVEVGHGVHRGAASGGDITMQMVTNVTP